MEKRLPKIFVISISICFWLIIGSFCSARAETDDIERINMAVNSATKWGSARPDLQDGVYDCEDFAKDKQRLLKAKGISSKRVVVIPETGVGFHMVLDVNGRILDNRFTWSQKKEDLARYGYIFLEGIEVDENN